MIVRDLVGGGKTFFCPGCEMVHSVNHSGGPQWDYNGNPASPTFTPSILVTMPRKAGNEICHSFVTDGKIQFLGDCTHHLANQTVQLPEWPYEPGSFGGIEE